MSAAFDDLFNEMADLSPEARARYFDEHDIDRATRLEIEELLRFDGESSSALRNYIRELARVAVGRFDPEGTNCGAYRLGKLLGRGGMGAVYLAERADGEVSQRAAVKLLRPGVDDPSLRRRFLAERQILAGLSHPNIASLWDAGHRGDGQPYLVMEYVEGEPMDVYAARLNLRQKVALFLKVCEAVSYLHRHLVVHRDLKPSNIFVRADGEPKLLDFGIAKMLDLTSDATITHMRLLTPDYASPEQAAGGAVTTATDIYSLGAVLYKLLTGASPHQFETSSPAVVAAAISAGRITAPSKLAPVLKGDLEVIIMKALRKEPHERYASVDLLAADLRAWLEWRPVQARSGDLWYRTRRKLRRHWVLATATCVIIASLSVGLYIANWERLIADRERLIAERRFSQLRLLGNRVIDLDSEIRKLPGSVDARQRLVAVSLDYLEGLAKEAHGDVDLAEEIAFGYTRLARIQGVNVEFNLGDSRKAEATLIKADKLIETVLTARPHDRLAWYRAAQIATYRMVIAYSEQRRADLALHAHRAVERIEAFLWSGSGQGSESPSEATHDVRLSDRGAAASLLGNVALNLVNIGMYGEAAQYARRAAQLAQADHSPDLITQNLSILANALRYQGDLDGALSAIREARKVSEQGSYANDFARLFNLFGPLMREGKILGEAEAVNLGRPDEAINVLQKALDITEEIALKDPSESSSRVRLGEAAWVLGDILRDRDPARSLAVYNLGIQRLGEIGHSLQARRDRAVLLASSSYPLRTLHRAHEAEARINAAVSVLRETRDYPTDKIRLDSHADALMRAIAEHLAETGNPERGLAVYEELLKKIFASGPEPEANLQQATALSCIYAQAIRLSKLTGHDTRAAELDSQLLNLWKRWDSKLPNNEFVRRQLDAAKKASIVNTPSGTPNNTARLSAGLLP